VRTKKHDPFQNWEKKEKERKERKWAETKLKLRNFVVVLVGFDDRNRKLCMNDEIEICKYVK
jgi:hypothetical protein